VPAWTDRIFFRGSGWQASALKPTPSSSDDSVQVGRGLAATGAALSNE
jgi:hypothetical protein